MTCRTETVNGLSCIRCDAVTAVPAVAPRTVSENQWGWTASAYSRRERSGDCFVEFTAPASIGTVVGLAPRRVSNDPADVPHGFYVHNDAGRAVYCVAEYGVPVTALQPHVGGITLFRIERVGSKINYYVNGTKVRTAESQVVGALRVVSCMYATNDGVG